MSLSHRHQQLVCYQLSEPESLVKILETAKCAYQLFNTVLACIFIGNPCKVKELEYCECLAQACSLINEESRMYIHTYIYIYISYTCGSMCIVGIDTKTIQYIG